MHRIKDWTQSFEKIEITTPQKQAKSLQQMLKHPMMQSFLKKNPTVTKDQLQRSSLQINQVISETDNCKKCPGLKRCPNLVQGHTPVIEEQNGYISLIMKPCQLWHDQKQRAWRKKMIQSHHISKDILNATFRSIDQSDERIDAIEQALDFCLQFSDDGERPYKGLYLYGSLGVGKSFIAGAVRQELLHKSVDSYMVYVPDFMREIRAAIGLGTVNDKLDAIKKTTLLILDDIGAEYNTPWTRDEVLGAILQYRIAERLPVIFTSNLNMNELEEHLAYTDKGGQESMKAQRIMERIRHYVHPIYVRGKNRRNKI